MRLSGSRGARFLATAAMAALLAGTAAGCKTTRNAETTGTIAGAPPVLAQGAGRGEIDAIGARHRANPRDTNAAIQYAQALRAAGQRAQAVAVLEQAAIHHPRNHALLGAYGRALADVGNHTQALDVLNRAHVPDRPDWRILSVQGTVLDQLGRHDEAQRYYATALRSAPNDASVLSNLGLSYALSKNLDKAETTLRRAAALPNADPRVRQNLALVVGLRGRFAEAEGIARADLPAEEAAANVATLRRMLAEQGAQPRQGRAPRSNSRS